MTVKTGDGARKEGYRGYGDGMNKRTSDNKQSTKARKEKSSSPPTKVVVRRLPPSMTEEEFLEAVSPLPDYDYFSFVPCDKSLGAHAFTRAYINFKNVDDVFIFRDKFDSYVFVDKKGNEYPAMVEYAPFQKIPKRVGGKKKDARVGTIDQDADFLAFMESLVSPENVLLPSLESVIEEIQAHERELKANNGYIKVKTPLLEFIEIRKAEKLRSKEEKREERRRKEFERKKAREDDKRRKKDLRDHRDVRKEEYRDTKDDTNVKVLRPERGKEDYGGEGRIERTRQDRERERMEREREKLRRREEERQKQREREKDRREKEKQIRKEKEREERIRRQEEKAQRYKDEDRPRYKDEERARYKDEDRTRYKDEDRTRYKDEDRPRYNDEDRPRYKDEDRPRYKEEDRTRYKEEGREDWAEEKTYGNRFEGTKSKRYSEGRRKEEREREKRMKEDREKRIKGKTEREGKQEEDEGRADEEKEEAESSEKGKGTEKEIVTIDATSHTSSPSQAERKQEEVTSERTVENTEEEDKEERADKDARPEEKPRKRREKDPRLERRIRNKDRPTMALYRPGQSRLSAMNRTRPERTDGEETSSSSPSPVMSSSGETKTTGKRDNADLKSTDSRGSSERELERSKAPKGERSEGKGRRYKDMKDHNEDRYQRSVSVAAGDSPAPAKAKRETEDDINIRDGAEDTMVVDREDGGQQEQAEREAKKYPGVKTMTFKRSISRE